MKKQTIAVLALMCFFLANCKKDNIETYNAGHYVQFTSTVLDTLSVSFFFYPNQNQVDVALPVKLVGLMPQQDLHYKIQVAADGTTASADHYTVASEFVFKKGQPLDTAHLIIKNQADLSTTQFLVTLQIMPDGDVLAGQSNYCRRVFKINNMVSKPLWWDANMDKLYLGLYTEKKFRTFMLVTGVGDMTLYNPFEQRDLMLQFKYYLMAQKDAGTPVLEADGTDMLSTVPLIG